MTKTQMKWSVLVSEWHSSGQSAEQFAEGKGFKASTLRWWAGQMSRIDREPTTRAVTLARVVRTPQPSCDAALTIAIGGARIVVARGFDALLLREVVAALGDAS
jgi:hypothetical protein